MIHDLLTDEAMWDALQAKIKTAEFRLNDRDFKTGDVLRLHRGTTAIEASLDVPPTLQRRVTHIVKGPSFGIPVGYALLSLEAKRASLCGACGSHYEYWLGDDGHWCAQATQIRHSLRRPA